MRLMIVEDNEMMRRLIKSVAARVAEVVCECGDGVEAVNAYALHRPDWVLMDLEMPVMDGLTATRRIKEAFPEAHICIVTNYHDLATREAALAAGAEEYLLKDDLTSIRRILR